MSSQPRQSSAESVEARHRVPELFRLIEIYQMVLRNRSLCLLRKQFQRSHQVGRKTESSDSQLEQNHVV